MLPANFRLHRIVKSLDELARKCTLLDAELRTIQHPDIFRVAGQLNMGFTCMLCIIMGWKDWKFMTRFLIGFQAVGIL